MIGETIDRYRVVEKLGQGGMGVVYKARDTLLGRFVALKVLPPERSPTRSAGSRFIDEAKAASALQHPGIVVRVTTSCRPTGGTSSSWSYVAGETLEQRMGQRALPPRPRPALRRAGRRRPRRAPTPPASSTATSSPSNVMVTDDDDGEDPRLRPRQARPRRPSRDDDTPTRQRRHHGKHLSREGAIARHPRLHVARSRRRGSRSTPGPTSSPSACCSTRCSRAATPSCAARQLETLSAIREGGARAADARWHPACRPRPSGPSCAACTRSPPAAGRAWPTSRRSCATCARTRSRGGREAPGLRGRRSVPGGGGGPRAWGSSSSRRRRSCSTRGSRLGRGRGRSSSRR